jgi:alanine racemase
MDQVIVDVGDAVVVPGDEAIMWGPGHTGEPTAVDWAMWDDTIGYEIVTRVGARVPRRYVEG